MRKIAGSFLALLPLAGAAQTIPPGRWDIVSTAIDLQIPGAPAFLLRMLKGKSKTEHKCIPPGQADAVVTALLVPDPKAQCSVDSLQIAGGRYRQTLSCPQKSGPAIRIERAGVYDASGFSGRLTMTGQTSKGAMNISIDQKATRIAGVCGD